MYTIDMTENTKNRIVFKANITSKATVRDFDGAEHLVLPVIAAVEMVMNGLLYTQKAMAHTVAGWNGVPITVNHPESSGVSQSANTPSMMEQFSVGKFFNVHYDKGIKGEIWINIKQAIAKGFEEVINRLKDGEVMEVSTGLLCDIKKDTGVFNSKEYTGIVEGIVPDHLALLPNETGACSTKDGCGIRNNCKCGNQNNEEGCQGKTTTNEDGKIKKAVEYLKNIFTTNVIDHLEIKNQIDNLLTDELGPDVFFFIESVTNDFFVCSKNGRLFKRRYSVINDVVTLAPSFVEVIKQAEFKEIGEVITVNKFKGEENMTKEEIVLKVLANSKLAEDASAKEELLKLNEETLLKLVPNEEVATEDAKESEGEQATGQAAPETEAVVNSESVDDVIGNIKNTEVKEFLKNAVDGHKAKKAELVSAIKENSKLSDSELEGMEISTLEKLANTVKPGLYAGQGGAVTSNTPKAPPTAPSVIMANLKKESE